MNEEEPPPKRRCDAILMKVKMNDHELRV